MSELVVHDERPPEYDDAEVEADLQAAADAGGLTYDPDMADDAAAVAPASGADAALVARTRRWLAANPDAVRS